VAFKLLLGIPFFKKREFIFILHALALVEPQCIEGTFEESQERALSNAS